MTKTTYHKRMLGNHMLRPETQMMGYGFDPHLSEGALKPPIFLTSTFVFKTAQDGKDFFDFSSGRRQPVEGQSAGLVYSRFNNPNLEVLEDRLALWDAAELSAVFSSGMSAISTALLTYLRPGDVLLTTRPLYGGTETLIDKQLPNFGITLMNLGDSLDRDGMAAMAQQAKAKGRISLIMTETPANPTIGLVDLRAVADIADMIGTAQNGLRPMVAVDNTFLGPVYQQPLAHGADIVVYSLTKYVGGHSDLVAGAVSGSIAAIKPIKALRGALGTQLDPNTAWMLLRSMETLQLRMERANLNAGIIANYLQSHPKIAHVSYLGFLKADDPHKAIFDRQCQAPGSTFAFNVKGGEAEAFRLLDSLQVIKLAVSLGGTETLISHPASTTHSGVAKTSRDAMGITDAMIRISVGIEHPDDLIADLEQALGNV